MTEDCNGAVERTVAGGPANKPCLKLGLEVLRVRKSQWQRTSEGQFIGPRRASNDVSAFSRACKASPVAIALS